MVISSLVFLVLGAFPKGALLVCTLLSCFVNYFFLLSFVKLSRKALYALKAMLELSLLEPKEVVSARIVANRQSIPMSFLEKILLDLRQQGLVCSIRGVQGGYCLGRHPRKIAVLEIFKAVGEVWKPFVDAPEDLIAHSLGKRLERVFVEKLGQIYLEDLYFDVRSFEAIQAKESSFTI